MIQVIHRALDILEYLAVDPEREKVLGDIARDLNLNAGTCSNILRTLVERNYVNKLEKQKGYYLGPKAYELTRNSANRKKLAEAAAEEMELLTKKLNENSLLSILDGDNRLAILKVQANNELQINTVETKKAYDTASGLLLLAMLSDAELDNFFTKYIKTLPKQRSLEVSGTSLKRLINKIRKDGFAAHTTSTHAIGFAVPLYSKGAVIASLSIYMPVVRFEKNMQQTIVKQLQRTSKAIEERLI